MSACTEFERFAACLRSLKERSGLSYEALAKKSGTSRSSLHRYCSGASVPLDYGTAHRLAVTCGAAPDELRTLHRLWALADAAREQESAPAAQPARLGLPAEPEPSALPARAAGPEPSTEPEPPARSAAELDGPAQLGPSVRPGPPPGADGPGAPPPRRTRTLTALIAAAVVLGLCVTAWTLSTVASRPWDTGPTTTPAAEGRVLYSAACRQVVAMGQHDSCVREVQSLLRAKGADIDVDSDFGPQTQRRVTAFQVLAGIAPPNGVVGDATKKALYESRVRMSVWSPDRVRARIREVFRQAPDHAVAIADCQSYLDPLHILSNTNGTRNWGVFQISDARLRDLGGTRREALDPEWNIQAAKRLWDRRHDFHDWPACDRAYSPAASPTAT